ncbi:hypothetical protein [Halosimplex sp. J119]
MASKLSPADLEAVQEAVALLDDTELDVEGLGEVRRTKHGIAWEMTVRAPTRYSKLGTEEPADNVGEELTDFEPTPHETVDELEEDTDHDSRDEDVIPTFDEVSEDDEPAVETEGDADSESGADDETAETEESGDDDDRSGSDIVEDWARERLDAGEEIHATSTEIADNLGVDGRAVPWGLKRLDAEIEKVESDEPSEASTWVVTDDEDEGDDGEDDENGLWCGVCGEGVFSMAADVEEHHEDVGHPGDPIASASDPAEGDLVSPSDDEDTESDPESDAPDDGACGQEHGKCACGAEFDNSFAYYIHRTEDHGVPQAALGNLQPGEFEEIVSAAESLSDIVDEMDWSRERVMRAFGVYGIADVIGPSDVEISDLTDFEFDGLVDDVEPAANESTTESESTDPIEERGLDRDAVIEALEGAQSVYHVARDLPGTDRDEVRDLLSDLDLLEELESGSARLQYADIEHLEKGVRARA